MFTNDELFEIGIPEEAHLDAIKLTLSLRALGFSLCLIEEIFDGLVSYEEAPWDSLMDCAPSERARDSGLFQRLCISISDAWGAPSPDENGRVRKK